MVEAITNQARAEIYAAAWRAYCATNSSDYASRKAAESGDKLGVSPYQSSEIARDAFEAVQQEQRSLNQTLLREADFYVSRYINRFANPRL